MKQHNIIRNGEITVPGEEPRKVEILPAREPAEPVRIPQPREPEKVPAHGHP